MIDLTQDNGWKMRPKEINHTATLLDGILIAKDYGVSKASIYAIKDGKTWKHVDV